MQDQQQKPRRRRFKSTSSRRLSMRELTVLDFLWTWKVASTPLLHEVAFKNQSAWWVYKALRQLQKEKYLQLLPRGKNLAQELWTLTEHGFEIVLMDRDDIKDYRYRIHSPAHDYLATCLQLGEMWQAGVPVTFYTEQALASLSSRNFPKGLKHPTDSHHIPDGISALPKGGDENLVIGYEVDLNLKEGIRYFNTWSYYQYHAKAQLVVWLVKSEWMAKRILEESADSQNLDEKKDFLSTVAFVMVDDFKQRVWSAEVFMGVMKGATLRKLHANTLQTHCKIAPKETQKDMREIFFPKFRSPQKLSSYRVSE